MALSLWGSFVLPLSETFGDAQDVCLCCNKSWNQNVVKKDNGNKYLKVWSPFVSPNKELGTTSINDKKQKG